MMNRRQFTTFSSSIGLCAFMPKIASSQETMNNIIAPKAKKQTITINQLGRTRIDDYAWLRDANWQDVLNDPKKISPEIRAHLEAENAYTNSILIKPNADLRTKLFEEMKGRIKEDDETPPMPNGKFSYYRKFRQGGQYPIIARFAIDEKTKAKTGDETIILDGDKEANGKKFWKLNNWQIDNSQNILAYSVDFEGARNCDIRFRKLNDNSEFGETLTDTTGEIVFTPDSKSCFYVQNDDNVRPVKVMHHILGTDPKEDKLIFEEKDHAYFLGIGQSSSEEYMFLISSASDNTECRFLNLKTPNKTPILFAKRKAGFEYFPDHHGEYFYFRTNKDKAKDYKIMRTKISTPKVENWVDYVKYNDGTLIEDFALYQNHLVRREMFDALPRIVVHELKSQKEHSIAFPEQAYDLNMIGGFEFNTTKTYYSYSSPTTPSQTFAYDMQSRAKTLLKSQIIPSGHNPDDYVVKRINAPSKGGALVPVTILYKKGTKIDGSAPCYLYGYGSYGISMPDGFGANILNLVNRGFVCATAHMRGGMERGYQWYLNGKMRQKQNTFTDYIMAAEALIKHGYASKGKIIGEGRSAGGLLMGVVANQRPDLFAGIIAGVAFVDMMNTISDETLPLTPPEWTEWGNPIKSVKDYDTMAAYSPYDNVASRAYPPIFAQTALSDSQVTYWEPAKWIAKLRDTSPNAGPFLLNVNMEAGHGGASGRFDRLKEIADAQAFALWAMNSKK
jgi:oligopeptidase B